MLKDLRNQIRARRNAADGDAEQGEETAPDPVERLFEPTVPVAPEPPERDERTLTLLAELAGREPELHRMLDRLDPWQLQAVLADDRAQLVRAQVGSGKTTVLAHKVLWLHLACGVPLERMAVLTFTNRAAGEIADRIAALAPGGAPRPQQLWLTGTFHAVALALLRSALPLETLGYRRDFRVIDTEERAELWQRLIAEHDLNIKHRRKLERRLALLEEGRLLYGNMRHPDDIEHLAEVVQAEKVRAGLMDFDDLLLNAQALLAGAPLEPALDWVIVDELQDCSIDQLELVGQLAGPTTKLFAVGDPNQVIYGWRGSSMDVFDVFAQMHDARLLGLPVNYRCSATVVACARAFLAGSGPVAEAQRADLEGLVATREAGEPLAIIRHHDPVSEAGWLAARLAELHREGTPWAQMAVMTRTRRQLVAIRTALTDAGVPVADPVRGPAEEPVLTWLLRLLRGGLFPNEGENARRALVDERWGVLSPKTMSARRVREAGDGVADLAAVITRAMALKRGRAQDDRRLALEVLDRMRTLPAWLIAQRPAPDADALLEHLRVPALLRPTAARYAAQLAACRTRLDEWLAEAALIGGTLDRDLAEVVGAEALGSRRRTRNETVADGVVLLTIHAAKGLEFDHVFISGANEGLLPIAGAMADPAGLAEERRLFFVALTRARHTVTLSWHSSPEQARIMPEAGPFLRLLPADLVVWHDVPPATAERRRDAVTGLDAGDEGDEGAGEEGVSDAPLAAGDAVRHRRYGAGVVESVTESAVTCRFESVGSKTFLLSMCPLERRGPGP